MEKQITKAAAEYYKNELVKAIQEFFDENDIGQYSVPIQQLSYYGLTPGEAKSLSGDKLATMLYGAVELISGLAKIHAAHVNYKTAVQDCANRISTASTTLL